MARIEDSVLGTSHYSYNQQGYLTGASYGDGGRDVRTADAVGNLFGTQNGQDRQYGAGGRLLSQADGTRYRYDVEGNLTEKHLPKGQGSFYYQWDSGGQLIRVKRPDGYAVQFQYDALGRRTHKLFRGKLTRWVWDGDIPLHEWAEYTVGTEAGSVEEVITWLFEPDSFAPLARLTPSQRLSVVADHLGTPLELVDEQGGVAWGAQLDSYGRVRQGTGKASLCPFRYQGQYEDAETGLYYNRFRYYAPQEGTYISQDPIGLMGGLSNYVYVGNPACWIDPHGLQGTPGQVRYKPRAGVTPQAGSRETGIKRAWRLEKDLINATGSGTRNWTQAEIDLIRNTPNRDLLGVMSEAGYTGHHINSVNGNGTLGPAWQGDPRNIVFLENANHPNGGNAHLYSPQGHRGNFENPGRGRLIDRQAMISQHNRTQARVSCP